MLFKFCKTKKSFPESDYKEKGTKIEKVMVALSAKEFYRTV